MGNNCGCNFDGEGGELAFDKSAVSKTQNNKISAQRQLCVKIVAVRRFIYRQKAQKHESWLDRK